MTIRVGINGFGRIGRMTFRAIAKEFGNIEVVGINDLLEADYLAYMLKYDSVHGNFDGDIAVDGNNLIVEQKIPFSKACLGSEISIKSLEDKELKVKVPAGIQQQAKLRLKGHGLPAGKKGGRGDIFVKFLVDIPKKLTNEQKKLIEELAEKGL